MRWSGMSSIFPFLSFFSFIFKFSSFFLVFPFPSLSRIWDKRCESRVFCVGLDVVPGEPSSIIAAESCGRPDWKSCCGVSL